MAEIPTLCPFALLTGSACPGCGMTRALAHLFRGDWSAAWAFHPLAPLLVLVATAALIWWLGVRKLGWRPIGRQMLDAGLLSSAVLFLAVWVVRLDANTLPPVGSLFSR
ncbi:MAG TPA: DUF2752 domain-containing protein [Acidimicrobiia bacterium]|nr:DUF2752 domain-containing protein [Acidimicrobiia bacterium]